MNEILTSPALSISVILAAVLFVLLMSAVFRDLGERLDREWFSITGTLILALVVAVTIILFYPHIKTVNISPAHQWLILGVTLGVPLASSVAVHFIPRANLRSTPINPDVEKD